MIQIIEVENKYIAEISRSKKINNNYLNLKQSVLIHILNLKYPFFILEDPKSNKKFSYFQDRKELNSTIKKLKLKNVSVYVVSKKYAPKVFGADEMGRLEHKHV